MKFPRTDDYGNPLHKDYDYPEPHPQEFDDPRDYFHEEIREREEEEKTARLFKLVMEQEKALTLIVAIKYENGIVLFTDTQLTEDNRRNQFLPKGFFLGTDDRYVIGCSGNNPDISNFVNYLGLEFEKKSRAR